jgi:hypothetical protein
MYFNETRIANLERNHVVFVAILFSCQGTDVRERAAILPDPHVRVKRIGFHPMKPIRLTRTRSPLSNAAGKDLRARTAFAACRDRGVYVPATSLSTAASLVINSVTPLTIPSRGIVDNLSVLTAIPASPCCTTCCADSSYGLFSKDPVPLRDQP